nr:YbhB/YbcL family Raf kinase inhibitor-like protein [Mesorhizobium sp.]
MTAHHPANAQPTKGNRLVGASLATVRIVPLPFGWTGASAGTGSFVLLCDDPDARNRCSAPTLSSPP